MKKEIETARRTYGERQGEKLKRVKVREGRRE